jgi:post-segregation antitoxin (ccd killing protein)
MILYTTLASITAVALGLALNVSRKTVRGLERELRKKANLQVQQEIKLMSSRSELLGALDKAKTWETRGEDLGKRLLVAENDLAGALQKLFVLEGKAAVKREQARVRKANQRARERAAK